METIIFRPFSTAFEHAEDQITARIYGRSKDGEKVCLQEIFYDYFYVDVSAGNTEIVAYLSEKKVRVEKVDAEIHDIPTKLLKIFSPSLAATEKLVAEIREKFALPCYEHDVPFERKFVFEKPLKYSSTYSAEFSKSKTNLRVDIQGKLQKTQESPETSIEPKVLYFDIETHDSGVGINYEKNPILMISVVGKDIKTVLVAKRVETKLPYVEVCNGEEALLRRFHELVTEYNPDILSGYNIKGFDIPYLVTRAATYGLKFDLSPARVPVAILKNKYKCEIEGIAILDLYELLRNLLRNNITEGSLSLNSVANELLGEKKDDVNLNELFLLWEKETPNVDAFIGYCLKDSELCVKLHQYLLADIVEFSKMLNANVETLSHLSFSQVVEYYLMGLCREFNQIIPNVPDHNMIEERSERRIQGAFVFDPKPGYYENIVVFDFRSLYPSIIESHNITKGMLVLKPEEGAIPVPGRPYYLRQKRKAFIPFVTEDIIQRRGRLKDMIKVVPQEEKKLIQSRIATLKIIANSLYGYLGFFMARWYSFECAESVTAFGRDYIHKVIDTMNQSGCTVIYSDTDSIFVLPGKKTLADVTTVVADINKKLPGTMSLELENTYKCGIFVETRSSTKGAKKKYALLDHKGKFKIVGMIMVRGDWSEIAKRTQKKVIEILLQERNIGKARESVNEVINTLEKCDVKDFIIETKLTKAIDEYESKGPHVIAAQRMKERGEFIRTGSYIQYIIVKGKSDRIGERARLPDEVTLSDVDFDYYIHNQILPALEGIFDVFGVDVQKLYAERKQPSLNSFFK